MQLSLSAYSRAVSYILASFKGDPIFRIIIRYLWLTKSFILQTNIYGSAVLSLSYSECCFEQLYFLFFS